MVDSRSIKACRGVAQPGSAHAWGACGHRFKSGRPDHFSSLQVKLADNSLPDYAWARERMVQEQIIGRGIENPRIISAMRRIPRHLFVDAGLVTRAYDDCALPIGEKQTISCLL